MDGFLSAPAAVPRQSPPRHRDDARALVDRSRRGAAVAAVLYPRAGGLDGWRAAEPRGADARDVDDGRRADGPRDPARTRGAMAADGLRGAGPWRDAAFGRLKARA